MAARAQTNYIRWNVARQSYFQRHLRVFFIYEALDRLASKMLFQKILQLICCRFHLVIIHAGKAVYREEIITRASVNLSVLALTPCPAASSDLVSDSIYDFAFIGSLFLPFLGGSILPCCSFVVNCALSIYCLKRYFSCHSLSAVII